MSRPITLFTGQWAALPFEEVCRLASDWGYDGLEIACWGDHFDVSAAVSDPSYVESKHATLAKYGLKVCAPPPPVGVRGVGAHRLDDRHQGTLPARIGGDGEPEGVRRRAAAEMAD